MLTKEGLIDFFDDLKPVYDVFEVVLKIAKEKHYNVYSKKALIYSMDEEDLKEVEKAIISIISLNNYSRDKYAILYKYITCFDYDKNFVKNIVYSDIKKRSDDIDFLKYADDVINIVFSRQEKIKLKDAFWKNYFEKMKSSFLKTYTNSISGYFFRDIDVALKNIYKNENEIENIEKDLFKKKFDSIYSKTGNKYIKRLYKKVLNYYREGISPAFTKAGIAVLLDYPEFRKMYIEIKLGD